MAGETSIWKKELSFKRKPKQPKAAKPVAAAKPAVAAKAAKASKPAKREQTSVWKKEISLGRKPKKKAPGPSLQLPPQPSQRIAPQIAPPEEGRPGLKLPPVSFPTAGAPQPSAQPGTQPSPVAELLAPIPPRSEQPAAAPALSGPVYAPAAPAPAPLELPLPADPELVVAPVENLSRKQRKQADRHAKDVARAAERVARKSGKSTHRDPSYKQHKKLVGLKIGASQIAAALVQNNGHPRLLDVAQSDLDPGIVVGGELRDPDQLANALKTFFRKNKLPKNKVRLGVSNNRIGVRIFEIAGIEDPKQLANAIRFRAQDALPIPLDEAVLDYRVLSDEVQEDGSHVRRVLLVVAHRELIDRYAAACRKAGLKLVGIDLEAFALLRALTPPSSPVGAGDDAGIVVVSMGHERSTLAVSDGRVCEFTRVLEWGGAELDSAIARALEIAPQEAALVKRTISLDESVPPPPGMEPADLARVHAAMRAELQAFARELVASLRFYQDQPGSLGIGEIVITGGCSHLAGLGETLERLVGVRVRLGDPAVRVKAPRKLRKQAIGGSLTAAIGLGIDD